MLTNDISQEAPPVTLKINDILRNKENQVINLLRDRVNGSFKFFILGVPLTD